MRMTPHKNQHTSEICPQESRITRLEERSIQSENREKNFEETLESLNKTLQELCELQAKTQATFETLKWIIMLFIGPVIVFIISEVIKRMFLPF